ncbi:MAG TPA: hypothetical protein VNQ33_01435, partial [Acidimicrobiales bacterium]|nr:hypothetical protein [Acidimicrobiales bacterium]
ITIGIAAVAIVLSMAILATVNRPAPSGDDGLAATPGVKDVERPQNTDPFVLAESDTRGSTTLPFRNGTTAPPPPITTPIPTTTQVPLDAPAGDPVCQGALTLGEMARRSAEFNNDLPQLREFVAQQMRAASAQFATAGGNYTTMSNLLDQRVPLVESAEAVQDLIDLLLPLLRWTDPAVQPVAREMTEHLSNACPILSPG